MMEKPLSLRKTLQAFEALDKKLSRSVRLLMGGGGAMILAHGYPLATSDIDAVPVGLAVEEIDPFVKEVARELHLPGDWLNPYFSTFSYTLPEDYADRLIRVFDGRFLRVDALGCEEMLIMKCFAHRPKDVGHARKLIQAGADIRRVEERIHHLKTKGIQEAPAALDFLDDVLEGMDEGGDDE